MNSESVIENKATIWAVEDSSSTVSLRVSLPTINTEELSKLPRVVEVVTTDFSAKLLKEHTPLVFKLVNAHTAKITRMPADFHELGFRANYFVGQLNHNAAFKRSGPYFIRTTRC